MHNDIIIRPLIYDDLPQIAEIHVRTWQQAYKGQMPQEYLDALDPVKRLEGWKEIYGKLKDDGRYGTFVAHVSGVMAGFLSYGPARDESRKDWAEIYAINILQEYWSKGIGYNLFLAAKNHFKQTGFDQTYLWVLTTNENALRAYSKWQGVVEETCTKDFSIGGTSLKEVSVSFNLSEPQL